MGLERTGAARPAGWRRCCDSVPGGVEGPAPSRFAGASVLSTRGRERGVTVAPFGRDFRRLQGAGPLGR